MARAKYGDVVKLVDEVRSAGVDNVGLLTDKLRDESAYAASARRLSIQAGTARADWDRPALTAGSGSRADSRSWPSAALRARKRE